MNIPSVDIKEILEAESAFTEPIYIGSEPAEPNDVITIFDTPGFAPMLTFDREEKMGKWISNKSS